jgi:polyadenylate-binding protein
MLIDDVKVSVAHFVRRQDRSSNNKWTNLYVKHFPRSWNLDQLKGLFQPFGEVQNAVIATNPDGSNRGFGFINFHSHEAATKAVDSLNNAPIEGDGMVLALYVGKAQKKIERDREMRSRLESIKSERNNKYLNMNLYVKNIADSISDEQFKDAFSVYGTITSARIMRDNELKTSKGFGFVCFSNADEAAKAVAEMNGKLLASKPLVVTYYQRQELRRQQLAATYAPQSRFGGMMPYMYSNYSGQPQPRGNMPYYSSNGDRSIPYRQQNAYVPQQFMQQPGQIPQGMYLNEHHVVVAC